MAGAHPRSRAEPRRPRREGEADPAPAAGGARSGRATDAVPPARAAQRLHHRLALPGGVVGGREVLQLAAAAGAEMAAGAAARGAGSSGASGVARKPSPRRRPAPPASARPAAPAARRPGGAERRDAVALRPEALDRHLDQVADVGGHRGCLRLQPEQAQARAGARIDLDQELPALAVGAEQQPAPAVRRHLLDPGAARAGRPRRPGTTGLRRPPLHDQHRQQHVPPTRSDAAGDHKGLEQARDVVHLSRR